MMTRSAMSEIAVVIYPGSSPKKLERLMGNLRQFTDVRVRPYAVASTDEAAAWLAMNLPEAIVARTQGGVPEAINALLKNITEPLVAFLDEEAVYRPEALAILTSTMAVDKTVAAAGGPVLDSFGTAWRRASYLCDSAGAPVGNSRVLENGDLYGGPDSDWGWTLDEVNALWRMEALRRVGGVNPFYKRLGFGADWSRRLQQAGYKLVFDNRPEAHYDPEWVLPLLKGQLPPQESVEIAQLADMAGSGAYYAYRNAADIHAAQERVESLRHDVRAVLEYWQSAGLLSQGRVDEWLRATEVALRSAWEAVRVPEKPQPSTAVAILPAAVDKPFAFAIPTRKRRRYVFVVATYIIYINGISRYSCDMARTLASWGHEVHVIAWGVREAIIYLEGVWVHCVGEVSEPKRFHTLPEGTVLAPDMKGFAESAYRQLQWLDEKHKVDIVYSNVTHHEAIYAALDGRIPTVIDYCSTVSLFLDSRDPIFKSDYDKPFAVETAELERHFFTGPYWMMVNNPRLQSLMEVSSGARVNMARCAMVPLGSTDLSRTYARKRPDNGDVVFLFVGRVERRKGIDTFLGALPELLTQCPHARVVLIGDDKSLENREGTFKSNFLKNHKSAPWINRVDFKGMATDEALYQWYADCDVLVAPSRFESFGLMYVEAATLCKPSIGTNCSGIPSTVEDGVTGILVPPTDSAALAAAMIKLYQDTPLRERMGKAAREKFLRQFTLEAMSGGAEKYFDEIIEGVRTIPHNPSTPIPVETLAR